MSFGFSGNNNNSSSPFGGFGANNNNNNNNPAASSAGGSLFGGGTATSGSTFGGFGAQNTSSPFGANKTPAFGAPATTSAGASMFGGGAGTTAGGFGSGGGGAFGSNNNASGGFGASNTNSGGLFGASKPATTGFGSGTTGGGMFGSSNTGFGANNTAASSNPFGSSTAASSNPFGGGNAAATNNTGFGSSNNTGSSFAFGGNNANNAAGTTQGTPATPFTATTEKEGGTSNVTSAYQSLTFQQPYQQKSFEELRVEDYVQNKRLPQGNSFGSGSTFGGFGSNNNAQTGQAGGGMFGGANTGATGGFGSSTTNTGTGFGGNTTSGGLFGNKPATGGLFGNNAASSGTSTGGFGATANSGGGLFGNNNNTTQQPAAGGGMFGGGSGGGAFGSSNNNTGSGLFGQNNQNQQSKPFGGFGASTTNNTSTSGFGGAFGNNNQQQTQQPAQSGGLFGASTNTGFGGGAAGGNSLFGNNQAKPATSGLFGTSTGTSNTGGGLFGASNNQQSTPFGQSNNNTGGGLFGGNNQANAGGNSLFGNNQNKPATSGLFGSSTTGNTGGNSLFGGNQQQQPANSGTSLFGNNQNSCNSLFGGNQAKPAGGSLFGGSATGGQNNGLFGGNNQNNNAGNSLFGSQNQGNSLFGGNNQNQNQNNNSLFGGSQQNQPQQNQLSATLTGDPYGNAQLFSSLVAPSPPVGPLATPLSGAKPPPKPRASLLSSIRGGSPMLSASQSLTPKPRAGYGFSHSTYASPALGSSQLTPGASSLLRPTGSINSALSGRLSKSFSTSNLRGEAGDGSSLLRTPVNGQSALLLGGGNLGSGSLNSSTNMRKLKINRDLRMDLFGSAEPKPQSRLVENARGQDEQERTLKKRVSFDRGAEESNARPSKTNALVVREDDDEPTPTSTPAPPQHNNGPSLDSVPEEGAAPQSQSQSAAPSSRQRMEPGEYWSEPSIKTLKNMSRQQLSNVENFTVGRKNVGRVVFGRNGPVDLTSVPLDNIYPDADGNGGIVLLILRNATVYHDDKNKPPAGQALNVPSTIHLEQSWPRSSRLSGMPPQSATATKTAEKELQTHRRRLSKVEGTTFKDYDPRTGVWSFTVEHYTTYGLDDSDDEDMDEDTTGVLDLQPKIPSSMRTGSSGLSEPPATGSSGKRSMQSGESDAESEQVEPQGPEDDTFEFKLARRSQQSNAASIPGGFGADDSIANVSYDYDDPSADEMQEDEPSQAFGTSGGLGNTSMMDDPFVEAGGAVQAPSPGAVERYRSSMMDDEDEDEVDELEQEVPGSFLAEPKAPKSILKPTAHPSAFASPEKVAELPWEEQLQRTMSPKKRDRQALRDMQGDFGLSRAARVEDVVESPFKKSMLSRSQLGQSYLAEKSAKKGKAFATSTMGGNANLMKSEAFNTGMDLINSLWGKPEVAGKIPPTSTAPTSHQYKRQRLATSTPNLEPNDAAWHESFKPNFDNRDILTFGIPSAGPQQLEGELQPALDPIVGATLDVRFAKFTTPEDFDSPALLLQKRQTELEDGEEDGEDGEVLVGRANAPAWLKFAKLADLETTPTALGKQEKAVWRLASILFDPVEVVARDMMDGMSDDAIVEFEPRLRLEALQGFWKVLVREDVNERLKATRSKQERALLMLVKGNVVEAAQSLIEAGNFRLAMLVAQLPGSETNREVMKSQIKSWVDRKDWSEFSDALKTIYTLLAGETCTIAGVNGGPEDRAKEFNLAERFGLDWKMAFAIRVQYGGFETIPDAVSAYVDDLDGHKELILPTPWHGKEGAEDTLLGLLRLHSDCGSDAAKLLDSSTVSGSALNGRLSWQFASLLSVSEIVDLTPSELDALTLSFASQLEASGEWVKAAWVLLHLSSPPARTQAISTLLAHNAAVLPSPNPEDANRLIDHDAAWTLPSLRLPASLIWTAKALYASSVLREPALQAQYLLAVFSDSALAEAHEVLCSTVGPAAVISEDYDELASLLQQFRDANVSGKLQAWKTGGKLYADFISLLRMPPAKRSGRDGRNACFLLQKVLQSVELKGKSLEVRVAVGEMGRVVMEVQRGEGFEGLVGRERESGGEETVEVMWGKYRRALGVV